VSAFTSAKIERILDLRPDLVLTLSDLQAGIAAELIRHGIEVMPSTSAASTASSR
jgi:iron complex transport system substrate-binding protein